MATALEKDSVQAEQQAEVAYKNTPLTATIGTESLFSIGGYCEPLCTARRRQHKLHFS